MKKLLTLYRIHLRRQYGMYIIPVVFVYTILVPYQMQYMDKVEYSTALRIYDAAQQFLMVIFVWYQFLSFRFLLTANQIEAYGHKHICHEFLWYFINTVIGLSTFLPYYIWLGIRLGEYGDGVKVLLIQNMIVSYFAYAVMNLIGSAIGGFFIVIAYLFMCIMGYIPEGIGIIELYMLPQDYGLNWYGVQITLGILLMIFYIIRVRIKPLSYL